MSTGRRLREGCLRANYANVPTLSFDGKYKQMVDMRRVALAGASSTICLGIITSSARDFWTLFFFGTLN